jgi:hypothetical protein
MSDFPNIREVLEDGGQRIVDLMVNALQEKGAIFQGNLAQSINSRVSETNSGAELTITMLERGQFLDEGVNGLNRNVGSRFSYGNKMPPPQALATWTRVKLGNDVSPFAVAKSIQQKGIKPRNFIQPSLADGIRYMEQGFEEAGQKDIEAIITQVGKESKIEVK